MTKKKKILLGTLIPLSIVVIVTSIAIPLLLRSCNDGWTTFKSANDAKKYFNSHKKVHDDTHDWSSQPIDYAEMCNYFWNRDNYGAQNMANGLAFICSDERTWSSDGQIMQYLKIKVNTNQFLINYSFSDLDIQQGTIIHGLVSEEYSWNLNNSLSVINVISHYQLTNDDEIIEGYAETVLNSVTRVYVTDYGGRVIFGPRGETLSMFYCAIGEGNDYPNIQLPTA